MREAWTTDRIPDQRGRVFVVTGANSGLGYETALGLAAKNARVILACRNVAKAEVAAANIRRAHPSGELEVMALDLSNLASVRAFVDAFAARHRALHVLVNNAGVMAIPRATTADGFEMQFGTNHLGHFALTGWLLPRLLDDTSARVVTVSSPMHRLGKMRFDNLNAERSYHRWAAYCQSKLANLLFTYELERRLEAKGLPVAALAAHPGYSATELQGRGVQLGGSAVEAWIMHVGNRLFAQSAEMGALTTLRAATDPDARGGEYYGPGGIKEITGAPVRVESNAASHDEVAARRLWDVSVRLTGVSFDGI